MNDVQRRAEASVLKWMWWELCEMPFRDVASVLVEAVFVVFFVVFFPVFLPFVAWRKRQDVRDRLRRVDDAAEKGVTAETRSDAYSDFAETLPPADTW